MEVAARAGVAGEHDERPGRQHDRLLAAGDADVAALERLAQRVDDVGAEQRELIEEEHAAVGPADLAGPHPAEPPPTRLAVLASWWGAENGGRVSMPVGGVEGDRRASAPP